MKKYCVIIAVCALLSGCNVQQTLETVSDLYDVSAMETMQQIQIVLPEDAAIETMVNASADKLYFCDGYTVAVQTLEAGDFQNTLRQVTGFDKEHLSLVETRQGNVKRFDLVWSTAGEGEDQVCRAAILDDGVYHYAVTLMTGSAQAGDLAETWTQILNSVKLINID